MVVFFLVHFSHFHSTRWGLVSSSLKWQHLWQVRQHVVAVFHQSAHIHTPTLLERSPASHTPVNAFESHSNGMPIAKRVQKEVQHKKGSKAKNKTFTPQGKVIAALKTTTFTRPFFCRWEQQRASATSCGQRAKEFQPASTQGLHSSPQWDGAGWRPT